MLKSLFEYDAYFFDLDDTLYPETSYLFPAYKEIAKYVAKKYNLDSKELYHFLEERFLECGRNKLFNKMNKHFGIPDIEIDEYLKILRNYTPGNKLPLYENMKSLLKKLNGLKKKIFIITNGNVTQQKNKIKNLDWDGIEITDTVYANMLKPKPSPTAIKSIIDKYKLTPKECLFIGDALTDKLSAANAGIDFVFVDML